MEQKILLSKSLEQNKKIRQKIESQLIIHLNKRKAYKNLIRIVEDFHINYLKSQHGEHLETIGGNGMMIGHQTNIYKTYQRRNKR